ncbi:hypothetical protein PTKIN_Ptkin08bG0039000 [Pterospermum kingtungense]
MTRSCYQDVLPAIAMVAVECSIVVVSILFKAAAAKGLSYYVFIAYTCTLATLVLLPLALFLISKTGLPPFKFSLISRLFLLALIGLVSQLCAYKGLKLGSPTLSSAISNLIPAFTFILAVFFRMEKVELRSSSSRAKIIGTIGSISGASVVVLYKGPKVFYTSQWSSSSTLLQQPLGSPQSNWVAGGLLVVVTNVLSSFWYIIQCQIMKVYPQEIVVSFISSLFLIVISVPICILAEPNLSSWRLTPSIVAASILYTGIFAIAFTAIVHTWGVRVKGPVYVSMFKPLSIVIAAFMGAIFLGDDLHLGSVIGALIISAGLYAVLWGKANEERRTDNDDSGLNSSGLLTDSKVPLL